ARRARRRPAPGAPSAPAPRGTPAPRARPPAPRRRTTAARTGGSAGPDPAAEAGLLARPALEVLLLAAGAAEQRDRADAAARHAGLHVGADELHVAGELGVVGLEEVDLLLRRGGLPPGLLVVLLLAPDVASSLRLVPQVLLDLALQALVPLLLRGLLPTGALPRLRLPLLGLREDLLLAEDPRADAVGELLRV